jgi:hypothetical protein
VPVTESIAPLLSLFEAPLGFPPSLLSLSPFLPYLHSLFLNLLVSNLFFFSDPLLSAPAWNIPLLHYLFDLAIIREILKINYSTL